MRLTRIDIVLVVVGLAIAVSDIVGNSQVRPIWAAVLTEIPLALVIGLRLIYPLPTVAVASLAIGVEVSLGIPPVEPMLPLYAVIILMFSVAANQSTRFALAAYGVMVVGLSVATYQTAGDLSERTGNVAFGLVISGGAWVAGRIVRARTDQAVAMARKVDRLEAYQTEVVSAERARIARELHDVVAHSVSVMVVQAGAAHETLGRSPEQARVAIESVQQVGQQALAEMGRVVGLLRDDHAEIGLVPQPGMGDVDGLVAMMRGSGLDVDLSVDGTARQLPLGVDLSAYRVLQEALTNAFKHGVGRATVHLQYLPDAVEIDVRNRMAAGLQASGVLSGGNGLVGMRERIHLVGGQLHVGPTSSGEYGVSATLPTGDA